MRVVEQPNREIGRRDRSIAFLIFGFLLACYLLTYTGLIQSSDGLAMFATVESMARRGAIDANQVLWMDNQQGDFGINGDLYSRKGLGMPILAFPLVWLARNWEMAGLVQAALLLNPLLTAWTGALVYRTGRRLGWTRNTAMATALIFGLGTLAWPYTQTFFSDPVCAWGLFAAAYGMYGYAQTGRKRYLAAAGLAWGIAYLARVINLLTLPVYLAGLFMVLRHRHLERRPAPAGTSWRRLVDLYWRPVVSFLIPVVASGLASLWWNWVRFGGPFITGYAESERFDAVWWFGISGLLAGPARGLIWYSPILLLALAGAVWFYRHEQRIFWPSAAIMVIYVLAYGKWYMWHGGYSWGPRFLVPLMPFLALWCGPGWAYLVQERRWGQTGRVAAFLLLSVSIAVQWLGMLIPFGLVQNRLADTVQPLFAPETFTRLDYSPLWMQWQMVTREAIHLAWWQSSLALGRVDWLGLLMPLSGVLVGLWLLIQQMRKPEPVHHQNNNRYWLYGLALSIIGVAMVTYYQPVLSTTDSRAIAQRIRAQEEPGDAILHLQPQRTQDFANVYHGRLPTFGLAQTTIPTEADTQWLARLRSDYARIWVVPDYLAPEQSAWERPMRVEDFLLLDSRPAGQEGDRLALYAMAAAVDLTETGLGVLFGAPEDAGAITRENGWIMLEGYALTGETAPGGSLLLSLTWRSLQPVDYDYHVFVHLLNADGSKLDQRDGQPVQWMRPTSSWEAGEIIVDHYGLLLPVDLPVGEYSILVGLYDPVSGQRLPINAGPADFAIELGPVMVAPPTR